MLIQHILVSVHSNCAAAAPIHDVWTVYIHKWKGREVIHILSFLIYKDIDGWYFVSIEVFDPS